MRLPDGCSVEWMRQPEKQNRLLEWLENHPRDRKCLFHEQGYRDSNKTECAIRAAQAIFANDENPYNSYGVRLDPRPFAQSIRNHIRLVWTSKYRKVNEILGRSAARRAYSYFEPGILKIADAQIAKFPPWIQLHGYWRELPQFNQFADPEISSEPTVSRAPAKDDSRGMNYTSIELNSSVGRKRKRLQSEESYQDEDDGAGYDPSDSPDPPPRPPRKNGRRSKFEDNKRRHAVASPGHREPGEGVIRVETSHDGAQQHRVDNSGTAAVSQYTPDQQFQLELAKIQRDMQVQQNKALEIAQKRDVLIMLFGPKNA